MSRSKEIITATGTIAVALGIGFAMQSSDSTHRYTGASGDPIEAQSIELASTISPEIIDVQDITLTSALPDGKASERAPIKQAGIMPSLQPKSEPQPEAIETACDVSASGETTENAFVTLSVQAPCLPSQRVTVEHSGMIFADKTDMDGNLTIHVPALAATATFVMTFEGGEVASVTQEVPQVANNKRVVLQWGGKSGFELHAREFGAAYGAPGHIWQGASADVTLADASGSLTQLGAMGVPNQMMAQVYTFPAPALDQTGAIDLSVEAVVNVHNCGREIAAQAIELNGPGKLRTQDLTLSIPDCDGLGDYLVLNNILEDLMIAAR